MEEVRAAQAKRQAEEREKKQKREAEWAAAHPPWFNCILANDVQALHGIVHTPGFNLETRYAIMTDATPLGFATISDRPEMCAMLVEAGANVDAEIRFWKQVWTPKDYCRNYGLGKTLRALETAKKAEKQLGVDFD